MLFLTETLSSQSSSSWVNSKSGKNLAIQSLVCLALIIVDVVILMKLKCADIFSKYLPVIWACSMPSQSIWRETAKFWNYKKELEYLNRLVLCFRPRARIYIWRDAPETSDAAIAPIYTDTSSRLVDCFRSESCHRWDS